MDPLDTYAKSFAGALAKMLGAPEAGVMQSPEPAACGVCHEYACSPTTGACFNCIRDPGEDRAEWEDAREEREAGREDEGGEA